MVAQACEGVKLIGPGPVAEVKLLGPGKKRRDPHWEKERFFGDLWRVTGGEAYVDYMRLVRLGGPEGPTGFKIAWQPGEKTMRLMPWTRSKPPAWVIEYQCAIDTQEIRQRMLRKDFAYGQAGHYRRDRITGVVRETAGRSAAVRAWDAGAGAAAD